MNIKWGAINGRDGNLLVAILATNAREQPFSVPTLVPSANFLPIVEILRAKSVLLANTPMNETVYLAKHVLPEQV